mmetsp:Transcript_32829/g.79894  ORF Transcript_32829/g.79894 Transcript_32829/m.79894 type:complete len:88 (-) Transcript_32829:922-1185(-)
MYQFTNSTTTSGARVFGACLLARDGIPGELHTIFLENTASSRGNATAVRTEILKPPEPQLPTNLPKNQLCSLQPSSRLLLPARCLPQ